MKTTSFAINVKGGDCWHCCHDGKETTKAAKEQLEEIWHCKCCLTVWERTSSKVAGALGKRVEKAKEQQRSSMFDTCGA